MRAAMRTQGGSDVNRTSAIIAAIGSDQPSVTVEVGPKATASSAAARDCGSVLPLFSARRRMPRQAVALKKNRGGTSPVSKISDNEHATAALWNSEVLSVENAVGEPIPEFCHPSEDGSKVPSSVRRQDTGDVLPYQPSGPCAISKAEIFEGQVATVVSQSASKASDAEGLAGGASDKKVNWSIFGSLDLGEVADERGVGVVVGQHGAGRGFDLGITKRLPAKRLPCRGRRADAAAHIDVAHHAPPIWDRTGSANCSMFAQCSCLKVEEY